MNEIILYRDQSDYFLKKQSHASFDYIHSILEEASPIDRWIKGLLDPSCSARIGNIYGVYKEGDLAYIYHDIVYDNEKEGEEDPYAYRKGFAIPLDDLITIIKKYDQLEKEQWDEIILQQYDNNEIKLFGRNYDPDVPVIMHFYKDQTEEREYNAECAYGRHSEIRLYFIYETLFADKWLAFLKNPQKKKFKGALLYAQKINDEIHLCDLKPSIQKKYNLIPNKIDITELIRLTNEWLELSKKRAKSITLTILHDMFQLQEG